MRWSGIPLTRLLSRSPGAFGQVTRVAREVGTEGVLGGQAVVPGVDGTWKDLTDSVNEMAKNLTSQVRTSFRNYAGRNSCVDSATWAPYRC